MAVTLSVDAVRVLVDGADFEALELMCKDVLAVAVAVAPCLRRDELPDHITNAAQAILRNAVVRWAQADPSPAVQLSAGPFSQTIDTSQRKGGLLWPTEIKQLQDLCREVTQESERQAFMADQLPSSPGMVHATTCDVWWAPSRCSCGAILTQRAPLWGSGW